MIFIKILKNKTQNKKRKILIIFNDMNAAMFNNKNLNHVVTELFIRGRKLNISLVFIPQSYFAVPKDIKLDSTHYFIMKIRNKEDFIELHLIILQILTLKTL